MHKVPDARTEIDILSLWAPTGAKNIKNYPCDQLSRRNLELVQHIINRGARGDSQTVRARNTSYVGGIINSLKRIRIINNLY